ncbi:hypothetical protein L249_0227 [Ophiocordyceps polyrhachis-furcata BCC 54312]|uniref:Uncharacterized protein n=1 Tax=Ophiocordyceps polyrhachis-furcata BCC 54312 TaxID=1330021 RepID=A0A367LFB7_9HYPO|nr:hypothetical protein L249_0227 [Ophiocordyceps polyrhachis-furcata BCC 54312]
MAPVRRYLRISKSSVLECRIYLDNPSLAQSWLLNPRDPVLPRIIESVRPLVVPKLREERERARKKGTKKKSIKDVVIQDDFEVSIFLTETSSRHSLLLKHKHFREKAPDRLRSNSTKLIGETNRAPIDVDDDDDQYAAATVVLQEDDDEDEVQLADIPVAPPMTRRKRRRNTALEVDDNEDEYTDDDNMAIEVTSDAEEPASKRRRQAGASEDVDDDKKKLAMDVTYEGFAIYGRVLCLVVKRRSREARSEAINKSGGQGQARMENWITSTQVPVGEDIS